MSLVSVLPDDINLPNSLIHYDSTEISSALLFLGFKYSSLSHTVRYVNVDGFVFSFDKLLLLSEFSLTFVILEDFVFLSDPSPIIGNACH